jgi:hypothetical protein
MTIEVRRQTISNAIETVQDLGMGTSGALPRGGPRAGLVHRV